MTTARLRGFATPLLGLWVAMFVGFLGGTFASVDPGVRVVAQIVAVVPLVGWAIIRLRGPASVMDIAICGALGAHLVASLASVDQTGSLEAFGMAIAVALLFWFMRDLAGHGRYRSMVSVGVLVSLLPWLVATSAAWIAEKVAWIVAGGGMPDLESFQVFIWATANAFPALVLMAVAFAMWIPTRWLRRALLVVIGLLAVVLLPLSAGRAGWLGAAVAIILLEPLRGWPTLRWLSSKVERSPRRLLMGATASGIALSVILIVGSGSSILSALGPRLSLWNQAIAIFASDPYTGSGPSTFSWVRLQFAPDFVDRVAVAVAHNVVVQTLADGGLVLMAGLVVISAAWLRSLIATWEPHDTARVVSVAVVIGIAVSQLLDDFSPLPAVTAMLVTLAAWVVPTPRSASAPQRTAGLLLPAFVLGLAMLSLPSVVAVDSARMIAADARRFAAASRWSNAADAFASAAATYRANPAYRLGLGFAAAESGDIERARSAYAEARRLSPGDPRATGALAELTRVASLRRSLLEEAARRSNDPQYAFRLALELRAVDANAAAWWMAHAVALDPQLIGLVDRYRLEIEDVVAVLPDVAKTVGRVGNNQAGAAVWDAGLYTGHLPPDAPAAWMAVALARAGDSDGATSALSDAHRSEPRSARTFQAAAAVARFECDEVAFRTALRLESLTAGNYEPPHDRPQTDINDSAYREPGLGSYQPSTAQPLPELPRWPLSLIDLPDCAWSP